MQRGATSPAEAATLRFFEIASRVTDLVELVDGFGECAAAHGFHRAGCARIATPGRPVQPRLLFGWRTSDWSRRYEEQRLHRHDPTIQAIFTALEPFSWDEIEGRSASREGGAVFDSIRATGAVNGLVVPVHGPLGEVLAVTLVSETEAAFPQDARQRLHVAASLFASRGLTLVEREAEPPRPDLTRREIQCVYWVSQGKSDWEIGRILEISEETVAWHVQNAKKKLGVARRAQLATAAWRRGVLLDESPD